MPDAMRVEYEFAARGDKPPVHLTWYQGIYEPNGSVSTASGRPSVRGKTAGSWSTTLRKLFLEPGLEAPTCPSKFPTRPATTKSGPNAIKTGSKTSSPFEYGGLLTESGLLAMSPTALARRSSNGSRRSARDQLPRGGAVPRERIPRRLDL